MPSEEELSAHRLRRLLTGRELDVLRLLVSGSSNREIAAELRVSVTTVRTHVQSILRKLSAPNRTAAAIVGDRSGLYTTDGGAA